MAIQVKWAGAWRQMPTGRLMYIRMGGVWQPILDMWIKGTPTPGVSALPANTFIEPFDTLTAWSGGFPSLIAGRNGQGLRADGNSQGQGTLHTLLAAQQSDTVTVGFAFQASVYNGDSHVLSLCGDAGATTHVVVTLGTARDVYAWRGTTTPLGNTTSHAAFPAAGTWFYVEVQAKLNDTTGYVIVHINGTEVLNLQNQDTKNAGTGTVFDSLRISSGNQFNQPAAIDDLYVTPSATFLGDINASSPPTNPPTSADHSWHKEPTYSPQLVLPTNLRMNPANAANHSTIPVAWDYSGLLPPDDYHVVLTDEAGTWLQDRSTTAKTYTFSGLTTDKRYRVYVAARCNGRPDTAWVGPLNWYLGADAYSYTTPVPGWDDAYAWNPGYYTWAGSWDSQHPPNLAVDGSMSTQWLSQPDGNSGGYQGDGIRIQLAGHLSGQHQLLGVQVWIPAYGGPNYPSDPSVGNTVWYGVYQSGGWHGSQSVYVGGKTPLVHPYMAGQGPTQLVNMWTGGPAAGQGSTGTFRTDATNDMSVDLLFQRPALYPGWGTPGRYGAWEIRLVLQDWNPNLSTQTVNVAAKNSASY